MRLRIVLFLIMDILLNRVDVNAYDTVFLASLPCFAGMTVRGARWFMVLLQGLLFGSRVRRCRLWLWVLAVRAV